MNCGTPRSMRRSVGLVGLASIAALAAVSAMAAIRSPRTAAPSDSTGVYPPTSTAVPTAPTVLPLPSGAVPMAPTAVPRSSTVLPTASTAVPRTSTELPSVVAGAMTMGTAFYVPPPNTGAIHQIATLISEGNTDAADRVQGLIDGPHAVWFTGGTSESVERDVQSTVMSAQASGSIAVLVAYNVPFRDCGEYSSGGAATLAEYEDWIDGFSAGIGDHPAIVILEPDALGIIPWYDPFGAADGSDRLDS